MNMRVIKPLTISPAQLTSSAAPELYSNWSSGTAYIVGDRVVYLPTNRIYRRLVAGTTATTPNLDTTNWLDYAPTNATAMIDTQVSTQTLGRTPTIVTISVSSPALVSWTAHGLTEGLAIQFTVAGGSLPTGIIQGTIYYVKNVLTNSFNLSLTKGGTAINTTTPATGTITAVPSLTITVTGINNSTGLGACNIEGAQTATVYIYDSLNNLINTYTRSLKGEIIASYSDYLYEPRVDSPQFTVTDIKPIPNSKIVIELAGSILIKCGMIVIGKKYTLGTTQYGASLGIIDYSKKDTDEFGITTFVKRAYSRRMSLNLVTPNGQINKLVQILADARASLSVWIATDQEGFDALTVFGFYKDFSIDVAYPTTSYCSLEIEGLT